MYLEGVFIMVIYNYCVRCGVSCGFWLGAMVKSFFFLVYIPFALWFDGDGD